MEAEGRTEFNDEEKAQITGMEQDIQTNPEHKRVYILGTDHLGRDMLSRILYGGRISIMIGLVGTFTAVLVGVVIGSISGYIGGRLDNFIMRFVDIMYSLPYMLLVIIMMALFGKNIINLFIAIALVSWLTICRVVRGQIISLKNSEFVEAARSPWAPSTPRIIFRHLTPNTLGVIVVFSTLMMPQFIMQRILPVLPRPGGFGAHGLLGLAGIRRRQRHGALSLAAAGSRHLHDGLPLRDELPRRRPAGRAGSAEQEQALNQPPSSRPLQGHVIWKRTKSPSCR